MTIYPGRMLSTLSINDLQPLKLDSDRNILLSKDALSLSNYPGCQLYRQELGILSLPSGRIIACAPTYGEFTYKPFTRTVVPGRYLVVLTRMSKGHPGPDDRIISAALLFRDELPSRWEHALTEGQCLSKLRPGGYFGYGVDHGTGCFIDEFYAKQMNEHSHHFTELDKAMEQACFGPLVYSLDEEPAIASFPSGWGDGCYGSYWGFNLDNEVVCLVTDFDVLLDFKKITLRFGEEHHLNLGLLSHPILEFVGLSVQIIHFSNTKLDLSITGVISALEGIVLLEQQGEVWNRLRCDYNSSSNDSQGSYCFRLDTEPIGRIALELTMTIVELTRTPRY